MLVFDVWVPDSRTVNYKVEEDILIYTAWVRYMVRHFKGRIDYYEILNEPNLDLKGPAGIPVPTYVNLIKQTVPIIREEDPEAKVVVGAVPDTRFLDARNWIWDLLDSGIMPLVDGLSWHGMYGAAPSDDNCGMRQVRHPQVKVYWENYLRYVREIQSVVASNGFVGEFMTEEMLWRTPEIAHETEPGKYTDISAAKYLARAIIIHLGLDVAPGLALPDPGLLPSYSVIRTLSNVMAGVKPEDISLKIESDNSDIQHYGFSLSNGDRLIAIWIDGVAVDEDPGVGVDLTINNILAQVVTGIDVLNGTEQEFIFENKWQYFTSQLDCQGLSDHPQIHQLGTDF